MLHRRCQITLMKLCLGILCKVCTKIINSIGTKLHCTLALFHLKVTKKLQGNEDERRAKLGDII